MKNTPFSRLSLLIAAVLLFAALIVTVQRGFASDTTPTIREVDDDGIVGVGTAVAVNSADEIVIAYFDATNLDLKVAVCENRNCYSPDIETVDSAGDVGAEPDIAIAEDDRPVISYFDIANGNLKLAVCNDPYCASANIQVVDDTATVGLTSSIIVDENGRPIISYYDVTNKQLKIAYCNNLACAAPNLQIVDNVNNPGLFSSLALDDNGLAVIAYYEAVNEDLKIALCNDAACSSPSIKTLDAIDDAGNYASLQIVAGRIFVSHLRSNGANVSLNVAKCNDANCNSVSVDYLLDMPALNYASMVMNNQGQLFISFLDAADGDLLVAACIVDPIVGCDGATFTRVDRFFFTGLHTDIALDHKGTPIISYHDQEEEALNLASCPLCRVPVRNDIGPVSSEDSIALAVTNVGYPIMTYQDSGDNKFYLVFCQDTVCDNFEKTPIASNLHINPSMALQENGRPALAYYHASTNELKYTVCNNDNCTDKTTNAIAFDGYDPTLKFNSLGLPVISYYAAGGHDLVLATCDNMACSAPLLNIVDSAGQIGRHTSMVLTAEDYPVISYYDESGDTVKLAICNDATCTNPIFKTAQATDGPYNALALTEDNKVFLAYYDNAGQNLRLLNCDLPCDSSSVATIDATSADTGWDVSIALDEDGLPLISYYDAEIGALRLAACPTQSCSTGAPLSVIDIVGGDNGRFSQMVLNGRGQPVIAHANLSAPSARVVVYDPEPILYQAYAPVVLGQ